MSSGCSVPRAIQPVEIPKKTGGAARTLGISTIEGCIAQTVTNAYIEPPLEQLYHPDSYGFAGTILLCRPLG
jgi:RNA-directed DNA polymerase